MCEPGNVRELAESISASLSDLPLAQKLAQQGRMDFVALERNALCAISDSGTVQEECCIFGVPNVTIRDVTERAETIECGSNILTGAVPEMIVSAVDLVLNSAHEWTPPSECVERHVSTTVAKIVLG